MTPWNLSCPDWRERLMSGRSLVPPLPLNTAKAEQAVAVLNKLRLFDVDGTPTMAEAGAEWFRDIVRALFGSFDPVTRARYIREVFLLIAKKNNKTTGGGLLMLTALLLNERPRAPFLLTAPVQKTADDAYSAVAGAIALDPVLERKLHVRDHLKTIVHRETQAKLEIMTFDPDIVTGKKVVGCLVDEVHVLGKMARASKAMIQLRGGMEPFPEAFLVEITTQSDEPPAGVFKEDLEKAREVRDGKRVSRMLPVLYEFPVEMQADPAKPWRDSANWGIVNPNAGRSVHIANLIERCADEELKGEAALRTWASQHLNVEIGVAMHANRWAGAEHWEACGTGPKTLEELIERCEVIVAGIDGGGLDDLLGLGFIGRETNTGKWLHWGRAWAHRCVLERRKSEASKFEDFADLVVVDDGSEEDVEQVAALVRQVDDSGLLDRIGVDQAGIGAIVDAIVSEGIAHERIVGIPQGWRMVGAIKTAERKVAAHALLHAAQPLMAYAVGNAKVEARGNAVVITKQIAGAAKIDPLMAMFNGVTLMSMNPQPRRATPSFRWAA
jgi:phage terminase large subunit-like protein